MRSNRQQVPGVEMAWIKKQFAPNRQMPLDVPGSKPIRRKESLERNTGCYAITGVGEQTVVAI